MEISKIVYGDKVLVDLTSDTVTADKLLKGVTAHMSNGTKIVGTMEPGDMLKSEYGGSEPGVVKEADYAKEAPQCYIINAASDSPGFYSSSNGSYKAHKADQLLIIRFMEGNDHASGDSFININSLGNVKLSKVGSSGVLEGIKPGEITPAFPYICNYVNGQFAICSIPIKSELSDRSYNSTYLDGLSVEEIAPDYSKTETKMPYKWVNGKTVYRLAEEVPISRFQVSEASYGDPPSTQYSYILNNWISGAPDIIRLDAMVKKSDANSSFYMPIGGARNGNREWGGSVYVDKDSSGKWKVTAELGMRDKASITSFILIAEYVK